jgi:hypothetical protein
MAHDPRRPVEPYFSSVTNGGLPCMYLSVVIKCDNTVLTSAGPGVLRLEIRLTGQSVSDWRFYFLGPEDVVGHVVPLMTTIPSYLTGS